MQYLSICIHNNPLLHLDSKFTIIALNSINYEHASATKEFQNFKPSLKHNQSKQIVIRKSFYVHEAPYEEPITKIPILIAPMRPKIRYNIVFLKTPEIKQREPILNITWPKKQEKIFIYVLHHQPEIKNMEEEIQKQLNSHKKYVPVKPEVFFVEFNQSISRSVNVPSVTTERNVEDLRTSKQIQTIESNLDHDSVTTELDEESETTTTEMGDETTMKTIN